MVAPPSPAPCNELESQCSDKWPVGENMPCPSTAQGSTPFPDPQVHGSSLAQKVAGDNDAHECTTLIGSEVCNEACNVGSGGNTIDDTSQLCGQIPVHSQRICKLPEAAFMSSSHHVAGSTSGGAYAPTEGPLTGVMPICGMRSEMEDSVTVAHRFLLMPCKRTGGCSGTCLSNANGQDADADLPLHCFGVYDGHGGSQVAKICKEKLHSTLAKEIQCTMGSDGTGASAQFSWEQVWAKVMRSTFCKIDAEIEGYAWTPCVSEGMGSVRERVSEPLAPETVGSAAIVAVIGSCQIIVANCGDSRAVLSRGGQAIAMSNDHKPNRGDEMERIKAAGGRVICWNGYRVFGVLAMSRAIGDRYLKPYIIAEPEVKCISRSDDDECLILASDGLWDVLTNKEVCDVARRCLSRRAGPDDGSRSPGFTTGSNDKRAEAAAALLTKMALSKGSQDNISVVVVDLKDRTRS